MMRLWRGLYILRPRIGNGLDVAYGNVYQKRDILWAEHIMITSLPRSIAVNKMRGNSMHCFCCNQLPIEPAAYDVPRSFIACAHPYASDENPRCAVNDPCATDVASETSQRSQSLILRTMIWIWIFDPKSEPEDLPRPLPRAPCCDFVNVNLNLMICVWACKCMDTQYLNRRRDGELMMDNRL